MARLGTRARRGILYIEALLGDGLSQKTANCYDLRVRQAQDWCDEQGLALIDLTATDVSEMVKIFPPSCSTRRQVRTALTRWWEWQGRDNPPVKAIRVPRKPHYRNRALSPDDATKLAKAAHRWHPEGLAVSFGLYLALRSTEIASAQWSRYDRAGGWYTVLGKFDQTFTLPVHPVLAEELELRRRGSGDWIFPGSRGRRHVTPQTIWNWVQAVADEAGIGPCQVHVLRHTAITTANDRSGDLRAVSEFARHARLETTRLYTRTTDVQLRRVVNAIEY